MFHQVAEACDEAGAVEIGFEGLYTAHVAPAPDFPI